MKRPLPVAVLTVAVLMPGTAVAGALAQCQNGAPGFEAMARCLTALDLETLAALQQAEQRAAAAAREHDERTKRGNTAHAALAQSARAFALYQSAQCDYVYATAPGANERPKSAGPGTADLARVACRIDLARQRIDELGH